MSIYHIQSDLVYPNSLVPIKMCSDCQTCGLLNHCKQKMIWRGYQELCSDCETCGLKKHRLTRYDCISLLVRIQRVPKPRSVKDIMRNTGRIRTWGIWRVPNNKKEIRNKSGVPSLPPSLDNFPPHKTWHGLAVSWEPASVTSYFACQGNDTPRLFLSCFYSWNLLFFCTVKILFLWSFFPL